MQRDFVEEFHGHIEGQAAPYMERFPVCTDSHGVFKRMRSFGALSPGSQGGSIDTDASIEVQRQAALDLI